LDERPHHLIPGLLDQRGDAATDLQLISLPQLPQANLGGFHDSHGVTFRRGES
jgi:hypothetical protein